MVKKKSVRKKASSNQRKKVDKEIHVSDRKAFIKSAIFTLIIIMFVLGLHAIFTNHLAKKFEDKISDQTIEDNTMIVDIMSKPININEGISPNLIIDITTDKPSRLLIEIFLIKLKRKMIESQKSY